MKVLLVNGSPHEKGCTYTALKEAADTLQTLGVEAEIFWIGAKPVGGCMSCQACSKLGKCVMNDPVNVFLEKALEADGFIFGSPVHYASMGGNMTSFMDRIFYANRDDRRLERYYLKPVASVASARRAGTTATLDQLNKYYALSQMVQIPGGYWHMVHGNKPEEVLQDEEGLWIMRTIARNMAWYLQVKAAAAKAGVPMPETEPKKGTNFIR